MSDSRMRTLEEALEPLAAIADAYDNGELDEIRPDHVSRGITTTGLSTSLYTGRGGGNLLTLNDAMRARLALSGKAYSILAVSFDVAEAQRTYDALYIGGITWHELSQERRDKYVAQLKKLRCQ